MSAQQSLPVSGPSPAAARHAPEQLHQVPAEGPRLYHCYALIAEPEPAMLPRVLSVFAKRGLMPYRCHATVDGRDGEHLSIDVQVCGLDDWSADHVGQSLRQMVGVHAVLMSSLQR